MAILQRLSADEYQRKRRIGLQDQPCAKDKQVDRNRHDQKRVLEIFTGLQDCNLFLNDIVCVCGVHITILA